MRISDWSSDVCSSDLLFAHLFVWPVGYAPDFVRWVLEAAGINPLVGIGPGGPLHFPVHNPSETEQLKKILTTAMEARVTIEIGRASCRESVCTYVSDSVGAVS